MRPLLAALHDQRGRSRLRPTLLVAVLALAPVLGGCLGEPVDDADTSATDDLPTVTLPKGVQRFVANGTARPSDLVDDVVDEALATVTYRLTGFDGAEPTIGITSSGAMFVAAGDLVIRSTDGGETWEEVYAFGLEGYGSPIDPVGNSDPYLWVDPVTDRIYNDPMFPALACTSLVWSDDDGASWTERHATCHPPPMDHQKLASGVPGPETPPGLVTYPSVLYQCYNAVVGTNCAMSYDGGLSFVNTQPVADAATDGCGGLNGVPAVSADGIAVVPMTSGCGGLYLAVTRDSGVTWDLVEGPQEAGGWSNDPEVSFAPDGTLYALWGGGDYGTYLARTSDLGETWDGPWRVSPADVESTVFWALQAGDDGRVAMAFLGTRDWNDDPSDAPDEAKWYLYMVTSGDATSATPSFTAYQVTPDEDPVQVGCVWMRGFPGAPCRNMLDFIDGVIAPDGSFQVAYTEGCTEGCAFDPDATPDDSRARAAAVASLTGWSLRPGDTG